MDDLRHGHSRRRRSLVCSHLRWRNALKLQVSPEESPEVGQGGQDGGNCEEGKLKTGSHTDLPMAPNSVICSIPCCQRRHPGAQVSPRRTPTPPGASLASSGTQTSRPLCSGRPGSIWKLILGSATQPDSTAVVSCRDRGQIRGQARDQTEARRQAGQLQ